MRKHDAADVTQTGSKAVVRVALAAGMVVFGTGCGTTCPEIQRHREAFSTQLERRAPAPPMDDEALIAAADLALTLPYPMLDRIIAERLSTRPPISVELPTSRLGLDLRLVAVLERVQTMPGLDGRVGASLVIGLFDGQARVLEVSLDAHVAPRLVTSVMSGGRPTEIELPLEASALSRVEPKTTAEGREALSRWLSAELPPVLRALGSRELVDLVVDEALGWLSRELWPIIRGELGTSGPLVAPRVALPELGELGDFGHLGIEGLVVSPQRAGLTLHLVSAASTRSPLLPDALVGGEGVPPERALLRVAGPTAMGLISRAMERGELPHRFSSRGDPDPGGPWLARVGWSSGSRPLRLHLWRLEGRCEHAEVAARVGLRVDGDNLAVEVREGRLVTAHGPTFFETFGWLESLFGEAMAFSFRTPSTLSLGNGGETVGLRLVRASITDELLLELALDEARRPEADRGNGARR